MKLLLLTLTLGVVVADAGNLLYKVQQKDLQEVPPEDGLLCPDQASRCSNTATCCKLSSGKWGCCPFIRATCCEDNVHCCPNGYMCHKAKEQCVKAINNDTMPWAKKDKASALSESSSTEEGVNSPSNSLTCPDRSVCPGTAACCRTLTGDYRCCSYPNNVCCSNGYSCCPRCTICDQVNNKCIPGFETEKWETVSASTPALPPSDSTPAAEKLPAEVVGASIEERTTLGPLKVVWCDTTHYCANGQTCCRQPRGNWGCCPYSLATCCAGSTYCCPFGKRCSYPPGLCF